MSKGFSGYVKDRLGESVRDVLARHYLENDEITDEYVFTDRKLGGFEIRRVQAVFTTSMQLPFYVFVTTRYQAACNGRDLFLEEKLTLCCFGTLRRDMDDFTVADIVVGWMDTGNAICLDDKLVPILKSGMVDALAQKILEKHGLWQPDCGDPVDLNWLAEKFHVDITYVYGLTDGIFGMTVFFDSPVKVYDEGSSRPRMMDVDAGTILIDSNAAYNMGSMTFTLAHELCHWILHRFAFELLWLQNNGLSRLECHVDGVVIIDKPHGMTLKGLKFLELQANSLAPCLIAPKPNVVNCIRRLDDIISELKPLQYISTCVTWLARTFGLSREAMRIRALECGHTRVYGYGRSVNNRTLATYDVGDSAPERGMTYDLADWQYIELLQSDERLRMLNELKIVVFTDNHICLNRPEYVCWDEDWQPHLTGYALEHASQCFIPVRTASEDRRYGEHTLFDNLAWVCRTGKSGTDAGTLKPVEIDEESTGYAEAKSIAESDAAEIARYLPCFNSGRPDEVLKSIIQVYYGVERTLEADKAEYFASDSQEKLAVVSGIDRSTLQRMISPKTAHKTNPLKLMAVCIAMRLPYAVSIEVLRVFEKTLLVTMPGYEVYMSLLLNAGRLSVEECNAILVDRKLEPLTRLTEKDSA